MPLAGSQVETVTDSSATRRLAALIRKLRLEKGWSQQHLADTIKTSRDVIKRLESGNGDARVSVLVQVWSALGAKSPDWDRVVFGQITAKRVKE